MITSITLRQLAITTARQSTYVNSSLGLTTARSWSRHGRRKSGRVNEFIFRNW